MARSAPNRQAHKATQGWTVRDVSSPQVRIILEQDLEQTTFGDKSRLYARVVNERARDALQRNGMELTRANLIALLTHDSLTLCTK